VGIAFNNFSIKNIFKPKFWDPLPVGDGQRLSVNYQSNGAFFNSLNCSFTEPWLGGKKPNSLSTWINHSQFGSGLLRSNANYSGISITGVGLGIFGPAIEYAQINLVMSNIAGKSNAKEIELLIKFTTKNNLNNSFPSGKYLLQDATIRFISTEENMPIEEVGESKFAVLSHEEI
jgi:hypothetical protein